MKTKNNLENTFNELLRNGASGTISIPAEDFCNWTFYSKFYTNVNGKNNIKTSEFAPIVNIPDFATFFPILEKYIMVARKYYYDYKEYNGFTDKGYDKYLAYTLLVNCGNHDFDNFTDFVKKRTEMLINAENRNKFFVTTCNKHKLYIIIDKMAPNLEAPNKFTPIFENEDGSRYVLPTVSYGFYDDKAYIGSIQGGKGKQLSEASRIMDRYLRKLNSGVPLNEIDGEVSPSALASLTIFNAYLKSKNVYKIVSPSFMPLRASAARSQLYNSEQNYSEEEFYNELSKKDAQQYRATNKFMYLFPRYCLHFTKSECFFDDDTQEMKTLIRQQTETSNNIIFDLDKACTTAFLSLQKSQE